MKVQDDSFCIKPNEEKSHVKIDTVRLLIKHGVDMCVQDKSHSMPLHLVAFSGSAETTSLLLEHGAAVNVLDGSHKTPLHLASSWVCHQYRTTKRGVDVNG